MSFIMPELVVESVIRDGIAGLVNNLDRIDDIFSSLTEPYNARKYGERELNKIKKLLEKKQINVVHNLSDVNAKVPCFSIQLGMDNERKNEAILEDFAEETVEQITDPAKLAELVKAANVVPVSYNSNSGILTLDAGTDLSKVQKNHMYVDGSDNEFVIKNVVNTPSLKQVILEKGLDVDTGDLGEIQSSLDFTKHEVKNISSDEQIVVGVHAKDALTTKYLYILLKYFLVSRKKSLIERCFIVSTFQGSDFTRNMAYQGDHVYHRFLTISGRIDDSWKADEVDLIENVEVQVLVPKNEARAVDLEKEESTVKPSDRDDFDC